MPEKTNTYQATRRVVVTPKGRLYPETKDNIKVGRQTSVELTASQAKPFGDLLKKTGSDPVERTTELTDLATK